MKAVHVVSPTNIALVKYWGKHPSYPGLFIPTKSSVSFNIAAFTTTTQLRVEKGKGGIEFKLNGKGVSRGSPELSYVQEFLDRLSYRFGFVKRYSYAIDSRNNFPTASGFASSASGFSALAVALARAMEEEGELPHLDDGEVSTMARLGSGSAARSVPSRGGLVLWHRGYDATDDPTAVSKASFAETLYGPEHFADLVLICASVGEGEKKVKSRAGMDDSVRTASGYWEWVEHEEKTLLPEVLNAAKSKKWELVFSLAKQASDSLHSICQRTRPPIVYLNEASKRVIESVRPLSYAAYTFDAGPNPVVITLRSHAAELRRTLEEISGKKNVIVSEIGAGPSVR